ncbi:Eco57I restriction-modification methylase domain-containing protein [Salmonirosea aquatica]
MKKNLQNAIKHFGDGNLFENAINLFQVLGYNTERRSPLLRPTFAELNDAFGVGERMNLDRAQVADWMEVHLLFQLTEAEMNRQMGLFDAGRLNDTIIEAYLFFAIELKSEQTYSRTKLADITRELNRAFPMPVMVLFRCGDTLSLSVIKRRLNKRDADSDVLEKVTIIKDIRISHPHRAHIEVLYDLSLPKIKADYGVKNFVELHNAWQKTLDSSELNKRFYRELANWYFWAIQEVEYPDDDGSKREVRNAQNVIRLLTRLIFVWFLKEKTVAGEPLIPDELFDYTRLRKVLNFSDKTGSTYYKAILQNLFFATLNTEMEKDKSGSRTFVKRQNGIQTYYRYKRFFKDESQALDLFENIPFLNGGLFENLDNDTDDPNVKIRVDCFSNRIDHEERLKVPDHLFFHPEGKDEEIEVDLNEVYGTKGKRYKVRPLIDLLHKYKFTIDENTPIEEEIALDPELLGKVFENLLASYVPETQSTARKLTGSFYTPREIVDYMVDESLTAHLDNALAKEHPEAQNIRPRLRDLFAYTSDHHQFHDREVSTLIGALDACKILDPACGSGAFSLGILHKMVFLLRKLDPHNERWKQKQIEKVRELTDATLHEPLIEDIERAFANNELDYGRKLYLIENCLYGLDIQPIAVQITKLRCFISLIVDQRVTHAQPNLGIRPLPNLELKFVAADSLYMIETAGSQLSIQNVALVDRIEQKQSELKNVRARYFNARTPATKQKYRALDFELRHELVALYEAVGWDHEIAERLVRWDPFDQNQHAAFFRADWMFNLTGIAKRIGKADEFGYFDIVLANPPYVRQESLGDIKPWLKAQYPDIYSGMADLYVYFVRLGIRLLKPGGTLTYILPNHWLRTNYGENLRRFLKTKRIDALINFGDLPVFSEATTYSCILSVQERPATKSLGALEVDTLDFPKGLSAYFNENLFDVPTDSLADDDIWKIVDADTLRLLGQMNAVGVPLKQYVRDAYYGIKSGLTEAFSPEPSIGLSLLADDPTHEIIKLMLMGRDIKRYDTPIPDRYLIRFEKGVTNRERKKMPPEKWLAETYPRIYEHLLPYKKRATKRYDQGDYWWELRACDYYKVFDEPKIMYQKFQVTPCFILDETGLYCNDSMWVIPKADKVLLGILNSKIGWFLISNYCIRIQNGHQLLFKNLGRIPIAEANDWQRPIIERYVSAVIAAKRHGIDITLTEQLLDAMVFELYFPVEVQTEGCEVIEWAGKVTEYQQSTNNDTQEEWQVWIDMVNNPKSELRNRVIAQAHTVEPVRKILSAVGKK